MAKTDGRRILSARGAARGVIWVGGVVAVTATLLGACSDRSAGRRPDAPGVTVLPTPSAAEQSERAQVASALSEVKSLDGAGLRARYAAGFTPTLSYDPLAAANLALIQGSSLMLSAAERTILGQNGFVISEGHRFPGFVYGYDTIYAQDLPLFVSADSILNAVHRSYDDLLKDLETRSLRPTLAALLGGMRDALAAGAITALGADVARDVDLYLAVPLGLLTGTAPVPVAGASASDINNFIARAKAATGAADISLFGVTRTEDFSQFTPRGHYTDNDELKTYFRAMMWLGRFDLRMIETQEDGSQTFRRPQFDAALGLTTLLAGGDNQARWQGISATLDAFVGEPDSMQPTEFPALLARLGTSDLVSVTALGDAAIADALVQGNFGAQRIASHVMVSGVEGLTLPLSRSFLLLGQRYVVDSHVFSNVVFDRVHRSPSGHLRMLPDPLDVAFAVFGDNQAAGMLAPGLDTFAYAPNLASMRVLVDAHGETFWNKNLYNLWLSSLRALSPAAGGQSGPLEIASTEPWGRRLLNTQLASWAELRHDTILYVKQSYSSGVTCAFPDALVEPNPGFFAKLAAFANQGQQVIAALAPSDISQRAHDYFVNLASVATTLKGMADAQIAGTPFTAEQMTFINETVKVQLVCGGGFGQGWYPRLFYGGNSTDFHPTIADVHTAPTDEAGAPVGNVLHIGTGYARLLVVTANTCEGPKAYAGLASSYFEDVTSDLMRLDDPAWRTQLDATPAPPDVPWMVDLIGR